MILAVLESIKYSGLLWPVALLRLFIGSLYIDVAFAKLKSGYLVFPYLNEKLRAGIAAGHPPHWYQNFLENWVMEHWKLASYLDLTAHFVLGFSLLFGYLVRPSTLLASLMTIQALWLAAPAEAQSLEFLLLIHLLFFALGAGRCLGVDYYFFRSRRGIWW